MRTIKPLNFSISRFFKAGQIPTLKRHQYKIEPGYSITGDQPKQFVRVYEYKADSGRRKANPKTWPLYIAKTAEKWYPTESITEHLLNRIGEQWEMPMAKSRLVWGNGQVRFLSLYFLKEGEELTHGADILAGFLSDPEFVSQIEQLKQEREFISVQVFRAALTFSFPQHHTELFRDFIRLLLFDALVGNNDRHFWNYGVIRDLTGRISPRFSPIFDTARGLYWNQREKELVSLYHDRHRREQTLDRYIRKSQPKMSWEGISKITHLEMVKQIVNEELGLTKDEIKTFFDENKLVSCLEMVDREFHGLLSPERLGMIKLCLSKRFELINDTL